MKCGYISAQKLESEGSKTFAVSISLQIKGISSYFRVPGTGKYTPVPGNRPELGQNHNARKAVWATLSLLKSSGAIFGPRSLKVSVQKVFPCPFYCKPRPSGVSLESPRLENILQVPENLAEVAENHDPRSAVLATLSVS